MAVGEACAPWYRPGRRASWRQAAGRLRGECPARFPSLRRRTLRALAAPRPCDPLGSAPEPTSTSSHPLGAARRRPALETRRRAVPSRRTVGSSLVGCLGARGAIQLLLAWSRASPARDARRRMRAVRFPAFPAGGFFPKRITGRRQCALEPNDDDALVPRVLSLSATRADETFATCGFARAFVRNTHP